LGASKKSISSHGYPKTHSIWESDTVEATQTDLYKQ
jgi:hypothetical protein